jgi:hypothetical protein
MVLVLELVLLSGKKPADIPKSSALRNLIRLSLQMELLIKKKKEVRYKQTQKLQ